MYIGVYVCNTIKSSKYVARVVILGKISKLGVLELYFILQAMWYHLAWYFF
jgi:hypothetical protein